MHLVSRYGGEAPQTPCGRTCALMGMIIGAAFLSLFTALLSSALTAARLATATYRFTQLREQDVTSKTRICTPSTAYPGEYKVLLAADTYVRRSQVIFLVYDLSVTRWMMAVSHAYTARRRKAVALFASHTLQFTLAHYEATTHAIP